MQGFTNNYQLLLSKLDEFTRKFYVNQLIRGAIYASALLLAAFLVISVLEYFIYFPSVVRTILFFGFLAGAAFVIIKWIALPLLHYFRLGRVISHEQAARIVGAHFNEIQDRLLNILQLRRQAIDAEDTSLIEASINQKIANLQPIPFTAAINLKVNRMHLRYLLAPVLALVFILFASPDIIKDSALRLIHHSEYFERQAPFRFSVLNMPLQTIQFQDFELNIGVDGSMLPEEAMININGFDYPLLKKSPSGYTYVFVKPQKDIVFHIAAAGFRSKDFELKVLPKPIIVKFRTDLKYPNYLGKKEETVQNIGDMTVPEGTKIEWSFYSQNTSQIQVALDDSTYNAGRQPDGEFTFSRQFRQDAGYTVFVSGEQLPKADSIHYSITVIPDRYPAIQVSQVNDSANKKYLYFIGEITDDYGLQTLQLKYKLKKAGSNEMPDQPETMPLKIAGGRFAQFSQFWDLNTLGLEPGDELLYYFEVWDNDGVNGSKSTRSSLLTYEMPTSEEMDKKTEENNELIKKELESSIKEAKQLKDEFDKMERDLLNKKNPNWEDKKKIDDLLQRQKELNSKIEQVQKTFKENLSNQSDYKEYDPELQQKQQELEKLFEQVLNPEMKEMLEKLEQLMDQLNKDKTLDQLQEKKLTNEELEKELDRMLALFKQLEFEQKFSDTKEELEKLAEKQDELSKETTNQKENKAQKDSLLKQQDAIKESFEEIKQELEKLDSLNQELEQPNEMPDLDEEQQQTEQQMKESKENMQKSNMKKAGENQKKASEQMSEMAQQMEQAMESMEMQQMEMDMQSTRQILENLIKVSFDQEDLLTRSKGVNVYNPQYLQLMKDQYKLIDDLKMVEDSIQELSKRVFQIESFVNEQLGDINKNLEQAVKSLEARQPAASASAQQYVMTSVNNLALMFQEIMQQMQEQMAKQMPGSQMCQKPGGQRQSMSSLRQMQKQLNDKMSEMSQQMKEGKNPRGESGMSKELAQMAAQQAALREALRKLNDELNKDGKKGMGNLEQLQKQMEQTETELVNKQLTNEMLKRQQEILTRLLEAENAERQRETDNKRESNAANDMVKQLPPEIEEYLRKKQAELELYKTVPPNLKPFYRDLVEDYFNSLQQ
ncbi:MAG: DUF4175 family protein [Chitinophagales bacterium]|nr:DUF4175 family protein [Chitinophagales bacterium]